LIDGLNLLLIANFGINLKPSGQKNHSQNKKQIKEITVSVVDF